MLSRWDELSPASVDALRRYLLDRLLQADAANGASPASSSSSPPPPSSAAAAGERLVRAQLLAAHACVLKRAWGWSCWAEQDHRAALSELEAAAAGAAGARAAAVALASLEAVVSEFAPATASPLGQPWEYHEQCRSSLQEEWLPRLWELAIGASAAAAGAAVGGGGAGGGGGGAAAAATADSSSLVDLEAAAAADAALSLASAILSWDFYGTGGARGSAGGGPRGGVDGPSIARVCPTREFRDLLLRSPAVASLLSALPRLQAATRFAQKAEKGSSRIASRLFSSARQVVVLLCGLDGPAIFPSPPPLVDSGGDAAAAASAAKRARAEHSAAMLRAALPWAWPPLEAARAAQSFANDGSELADACRALGALAAAQGAAVLSEVPVEVPAVSTSAAAAAAAAGVAPSTLTSTTTTISGLSAFAELSIACLATGGADGEADGGGGPAGDASAVLLDGLVDALGKDEVEMVQEKAIAEMAAAANNNGNGASSSSAVLDPAQRSLPTPLPPAVVEASSRVFSALVSAELASAAAGAAEDEDEGEATAAAEEEGSGGGGDSTAAATGACRAAAIGHASATASCRLLAQALAAVRAELARASAAGSDPSVPLEQLVWLARAGAVLLAEAPDDGEPSLPPRIAEASALAAASGSGEDPVLALSSALLEVAAHVGSGVSPQAASQPARTSSSPPPPPPCSPRLLEAFSLALSRWSATYLLPDLSEQQHKLPAWKQKPFPRALALAFGGPALGGQGEATLAGLARLAVSWLASTPGETDLHSAVAKRLLPALERRAEAAAALLAKGVSPEWTALAEAFSFQGGGGGGGGNSTPPPPPLAPVLDSLAEPLLRALGAALARAASGAPDAASASAFVSRLAGGPSAKLALLAAEATGGAAAPASAASSSASSARASSSARGQLASACVRAAEGWRGLIKGCPSRDRPALASAFGLGAAGAMEQLAAAFRGAGNPAVAKALLRLAADAVDALAPHAPTPADGAALARWALGIARAHAASRAGLVAVAASARLRESEADDRERELRALVKLVAKLASRAAVADSTPGAGAAEEEGSSSSASVFSAFEALLPLVTPEALSYPKLSRAFYGLLGDVLETWPERVPGLPAELGGALLSSLDAGAASSDPASAGPCLEALGSLALWAASNSSAPGAAGQEAQQLGAALARRFVGPLLARLLLDGGSGSGSTNANGLSLGLSAVVSREATDAGADALLPLASAAPLAWREACDALVASVEREESARPAAAAAPGENRAARLRAALAALEASARPDDSIVAGAATAATTPSGRAIVSSRVVQERAVKRKFRAAMARFVADARGIVRTC